MCTEQFHVLHLSFPTFFTVGQALHWWFELRSTKRNSLFLVAKLMDAEDHLILFQGLWFYCVYAIFLNLVSCWPGAEETRDCYWNRQKQGCSSEKLENGVLIYSIVKFLKFKKVTFGRLLLLFSLEWCIEFFL